MNLFKKLRTIALATSALAVLSSYALAAQQPIDPPKVYDTAADIKCNSDASCQATPNIIVNKYSYNDATGVMNLTWHAVSDGLCVTNYYRPSGPATGCFVPVTPPYSSGALLASLSSYTMTIFAGPGKGFIASGYNVAGVGGGAMRYSSACTVDLVMCFQDAVGNKFVRDLGGSNLIPQMGGADNTGSTDSTTAINRALTASAAYKIPLFCGSGTFAHSGVLYVAGTTFYGTPDCTLLATDTTGDQQSVALSGTRPRLSGMTISTNWAGVRHGNLYSNAVTLYPGTVDAMVDKTIITGSAAVGIFTQTATRPQIVQNSVHNTLADGIHFTKGTTNFSAIGNRLYNIGDDCIAVVSYVSDGAVVDGGTETANLCDTGAARGYSVIGGKNIVISTGVLKNIALANIIVAQENSYSTYGVSNVIVSDIIEVGGGSNSGTVLGANVITSDSPTYPVTNVSLRHIVATGLKFTGLQIGANTSDISLSDSSLYAVGGSTPYTAFGATLGGVNNASFHHNAFGLWSKDGIAAGTFTNSGTLSIKDNYFDGLNQSASTSVRAISDYNSGFGALIATGNSPKNNGSTIDALILTTNTNSVISDNWPVDNSLISVPANTYIWRSVGDGQSTSIPTGACAPGSTSRNVTATSGNPWFWICKTGNVWAAGPNMP